MTDTNRFENLRSKLREYKTGVYAFTFENAYLIYYYKRADGKRTGAPDGYKYDYLSLDIRTGLNSYICSKRRILQTSLFRSLTPEILHSIKYTGDKRNTK
jgi:hypothetical protein